MRWPDPSLRCAAFSMTGGRTGWDRSGGPGGAGGAFRVRLSRAWRMVSHVMTDTGAFVRRPVRTMRFSKSFSSLPTMHHQRRIGAARRWNSCRNSRSLTI